MDHYWSGVILYHMSDGYPGTREKITEHKIERPRDLVRPHTTEETELVHESEISDTGNLKTVVESWSGPYPKELLSPLTDLTRTKIDNHLLEPEREKEGPDE